MKRVLVLLACSLLATSLFALGNRESLTEEEALARIDQKIASLGLTLTDAKAAEQAFTAILGAGLQIRNALAIVTDALDDGSEAAELNEVATLAKQLQNEGRDPRAFEKEVRAKLTDRTPVQAQTRENTAGSTDSAVPPAAPAGSPGTPAGQGNAPAAGRP